MLLGGVGDSLVEIGVAELVGADGDADAVTVDADAGAPDAVDLADGAAEAAFEGAPFDRDVDAGAPLPQSDGGVAASGELWDEEKQPDKAGDQAGEGHPAGRPVRLEDRPPPLLVGDNHVVGAGGGGGDLDQRDDAAGHERDRQEEPEETVDDTHRYTTRRTRSEPDVSWLMVMLTRVTLSPVRLSIRSVTAVRTWSAFCQTGAG